MRRELTQLGRHFLLSLGGEGLQSGFHFVLNLVLIRLLTAYDYGIFAIAFILGAIALTYGNALVSVPAAVHMPRLKSRGAVDYQDVMFGSIALLLAGVIGLIVATGLWFTTGQVVEALAGGLFVALWTLRNHVRTAMFARRMMPAATLSDLAYSLSGVVFVAAALALHPKGAQVTNVLLALAAANLVAIIVALRGLGARVRVSLRAGIWRRYRMIRSDIAWSVIGTTTWNIQSQALMFLVAAVVGPAAYAPIAAGVVLFSPLRPAINAFINVFRPDFAAALADGRLRRIRVTLYAVTAIIILACVAVGAGLWLIWPMLDTYVFAGKFAGASMPLIVALSGLIAVIYLTYNVPLALIQAAGAFKPVALATTFGGLTGFCAVSILLSLTSVAWSLAGLVAGEAVCAIYLWTAGLAILRSRSAPAFRAMPAPAGAGVHS